MTHGILKERKSVLLVCLLLYWEESYTIASTAYIEKLEIRENEKMQKR